MHDLLRDWQIPRFYDFLGMPSFRSQGRCFGNGESDNAERPEVPAQESFQFASWTRDRDEVMATQSETRGVIRDRLADCPPERNC